VAIMRTEPVTNMAHFDMEMIDVFRQQIQGNLYKVWPTKPLPPGEYAMVQYAEGDAGEMLVWDFRVAGQAKSQ